MYTFLMVDDEEIIIKGFTEKIDWEAEGFRFLPPCRNGQEAIESIERNRPDVVMTDICMPLTDGLEVAANVADRFPEITVVILSGYDEFEYAQRAMRTRVWDYVLKPITSRQLKELVRKLRAKLDADRKSLLDFAHLKEQAAKSRELLQERFLTQLAMGCVSEGELDRYQASFGPVFSGSLFAIVTVDPDDPRLFDSLPQGLHPDLYILGLKKRIEGLLPEGSRNLVFQTPERRIVVLLQEDREDRLDAALMRLPEEILKAARMLSGMPITVGVGGKYKSPLDVRESYQESLAAIRERFLQGGDAVIRFAPTMKDRWPPAQAFRAFSVRISAALRAESLEETTRIVRSFLSTLKAEALSATRVEKELRRFCLSLLDTLEEMGVEADRADGSAEADPLQSVSHAHSLDEVEVLLVELCRSGFERMRHRRRDFTERKVFEAKQFISEHFAEESLGAERICGELAISASYLTRLLKKHEGKTFIEYLTEYRIGKARELLRGTELKQSAIAQAVGYPDPHYFSFIFKKATGLTPTEFRGT
jgi:two-component system response regulator YesN